VTLAVGCDEGDAHFTVNFASDFSPARNTVSVLGVYKDGRMSASGWEALAPRFEPALGGAHCEAGYNTLASSDGVLAGAIDDYARAEGPTDDLLALISPAARGDLILVVTFAGELPQRAADAGAQRSAPTTPSPGGRGRRARGQTAGRTPNQSSVATDLLDVSASLYSVAEWRSIALVAMQYSGASLDEATTKFAAKLSQSLPGLLCVGWGWEDAKIDPEQVHKSIDNER
jgi:hypothetical protein